MFELKRPYEAMNGNICSIAIQPRCQKQNCSKMRWDLSTKNGNNCTCNSTGDKHSTDMELHSTLAIIAATVTPLPEVSMTSGPNIRWVLVAEGQIKYFNLSHQGQATLLYQGKSLMGFWRDGDICTLRCVWRGIKCCKKHKWGEHRLIVRTYSPNLIIWRQIEIDLE